jgi:rubrerythrin
MTPEQAIAATLGTGTCHEVMINRHWRGCGECGYVWENMYGEGFQKGPNYCPMCGRRVEQ